LDTFFALIIRSKRALTKSAFSTPFTRLAEDSLGLVWFSPLNADLPRRAEHDFKMSMLCFSSQNFFVSQKIFLHPRVFVQVGDFRLPFNSSALVQAQHLEFINFLVS